MTLIQSCKSQRFCCYCMKPQTFILNEITNHSECKVCHRRDSINIKGRDKIAWFKKGYYYHKKVTQ